MHSPLGRAAITRFLLVGLSLVAVSGCHRDVPATLEAVTIRGDSPSFFAFGDWGARSKGQRDVADAVGRACDRWHCDFGLLLGDNFYPSGVRSVDDPLWKSHYLDVYEKLLWPLYVVLGNHDHGGNARAQMEYRDPAGRWRMPSAYYEFAAGDAVFFALDTTRWSRAQRDWLDGALANAADKRWRVVFGHHPVFSHGASHGDTPVLVKELLPVLERRNVQLYLSGHDHDRQVLRASPTGTIFVVSGAGGAELRPVGSGPKSLFGKATFGAVHVALTAGGAKLRCFDTADRVDFELALEANGGECRERGRGIGTRLEGRLAPSSARGASPSRVRVVAHPDEPAERFAGLLFRRRLVGGPERVGNVERAERAPAREAPTAILDHDRLLSAAKQDFSQLRELLDGKRHAPAHFHRRAHRAIEIEEPRLRAPLQDAAFSAANRTLTAGHGELSPAGTGATEHLFGVRERDRQRASRRSHRNARTACQDRGGERNSETFHRASSSSKGTTGDHFPSAPSSSCSDARVTAT
jgi:acid phosphatase